jgi:hypothetical protein
MVRRDAFCSRSCRARQAFEDRESFESEIAAVKVTR